MATTPTYEAATGIALGTRGATSVPEPRPKLRDMGPTLDRAEQVYQRTVYQSNTGAAVAFFAACAIAVGAPTVDPIPLVGLLAIALISTGSSIPLARYRFRAEILRAAQREGLSTGDGQALAAATDSQWSVSAKSGKPAMKSENQDAKRVP